MSRRMFVSTLFALILGTSIASAFQTPPPPNLTGTWTGTLANAADPSDSDPAHLELKQTGAELTGTGGPSPDRQYQILKGKVTTTKEGTNVTFEVATDNMSMQFEMKLTDGRLKGSVNASRGTESRAGTADFGRAK